MKIPKSELLAPGVECRTVHSGIYVITSNESRTKFTLWRVRGDEYDKISTNKSIIALYDKIPWMKK